jgi:hypothetical protein
MNTFPITLRFAVGTSVQKEKMITDLSKQVQDGFDQLIQSFIHELETENNKIDIQCHYDSHGRIVLDLLVSTDMNYQQLFDQLDDISYWKYPSVVSNATNTNYYLVDMEYV